MLEGRLAEDASQRAHSKVTSCSIFSLLKYPLHGFFNGMIGLFPNMSLSFDLAHKHQRSVCSGPGRGSRCRVWLCLLWSWLSVRKRNKMSRDTSLMFPAVRKLHFICLFICLTGWLVRFWHRDLSVLPKLASNFWPGLVFYIRSLSSWDFRWHVAVRKFYVRPPW